MDKIDMVRDFGAVKTTRAYNGYIHSVGRTLTLTILGSLCGLKSIAEIHQWATSERVRAFLIEQFAIHTIPTCSWLEKLLGIIDPVSLNKRFTEWTTTLLPEALKDLTIAFDGKTICSTGKMSSYDEPLHILSAYLCELGLTLSQKTVSEKSNEIPAMRELLGLINVRGCMVVADALHTQTKTAEAIVSAKGDYLLVADGNQETLEQDIADYVNDDELRFGMSTAHTTEKNGGRIELRNAFVSDDVDWMETHLKKWANLSCFGAIRRRFTVGEKTTDKWH
jgi:predicted transposase YbfD/YdcC